MSSGQTAVIVGAGQLSSRRGHEDPPPGPLELLAEVATAAANDAGGVAVLDHVDTIVALPVHSWRTSDPAGELARALGLAPARTVRAGNGGDIGVVALNWAAEQIQSGAANAVLVVGANNLRSVDLAARRGVALAFDGTITEEPETLSAYRAGSSDEENAVGLDRPVHMYPLFENALRAWRGQSISEHRRSMGELFSRFTEVAASNPHAWFPTARSAEELAEPTPDNRMIAFPYPKLLNAVLSTDQAAAVLVMSSDAASRAGVTTDRRAHWWGGGAAVEESWYVSQRPDLAFCPAMEHAHQSALRNAGVDIDEIGRFDFYSCFPAAVEMALRVLDLQADDPRGFTVTGGLPYAGGPGSAYTLHSLAAMYAVLREEPGTIGMVTGNGWYLTKHAATILSMTPPRAAAPTSVTPPVDAAAAKRAEPLPLVRAEGPGRVDSYTVVHDGQGSPVRGIIVGSFPDGSRFLANTSGEESVLRSFETTEMVGQPGRVVDDGGPTLRFEPEGR